MIHKLLIHYFSIQNSLTSLSAASSLHSSYLNQLQPDPEVLSYIKLSIRSHKADHLSAMIYFSSLLQVKDPELWNLYEMQITRSPITDEMSLTSLIKSLEGLCRYSPSLYEALDMLEFKISKRLNTDQYDPAVLVSCLYIFSSLNRRKISSEIHKKLVLSKSVIKRDQAVKILWSLLVLGFPNNMLGEWLRVIQSETSTSLSSYDNMTYQWLLSHPKIQILK